MNPRARASSVRDAFARGRPGELSRSVDKALAVLDMNAIDQLIRKAQAQRKQLADALKTLIRGFVIKQGMSHAAGDPAGSEA